MAQGRVARWAANSEHLYIVTSVWLTKHGLDRQAALFSDCILIVFATVLYQAHHSISILQRTPEYVSLVSIVIDM